MTVAFEELVCEWQERAGRLREYGADQSATAVERCAAELSDRVTDWADTLLTLEQSAEESGYSVAHLRRLVRQNVLKDIAEHGPTMLRRGDLPLKPRRLR